jgi:hypothetical protein
MFHSRSSFLVRHSSTRTCSTRKTIPTPMRRSVVPGLLGQLIPRHLSFPFPTLAKATYSEFDISTKWRLPKTVPYPSNHGRDGAWRGFLVTTSAAAVRRSVWFPVNPTVQNQLAKQRAARSHQRRTWQKSTSSRRLPLIG